MGEKIIVNTLNLNLGSNNFEFKVGKKFFEMFDHHDFIDADILVYINIFRDNKEISAFITIKGIVIVECDRCLESLSLQVSCEDVFYLKPSDLTFIDDNVIPLKDNQEEVDVSTNVFDMIVLSIPIRKVHPDDETGISTCNPNQLAFFRQTKEEKSVDPRWEVLKNLKK